MNIYVYREKASMSDAGYVQVVVLAFSEEAAKRHLMEHVAHSGPNDDLRLVRWGSKWPYKIVKAEAGVII